MPSLSHLPDNDQEKGALTELCQQMKELHQVDMDRNELCKKIVDKFFKESEVE